MKKLLTLSIIFVVILSSFVASSPRVKASSSPATIRVPQDYPTIQEAINAANPGDTVYVSSGIYYENLVVSKSLSLMGENSIDTILDGGGSEFAISITDTSDVTVSTFTIRNAQTGVVVKNSPNVAISENIIQGLNGVDLSESTQDVVHSNLFEYPSGWTAILTHNGNNITKNQISDFGHAIDINGYNNFVFFNSLAENYGGISFGWDGRYNTVVGNTVSNGFWGISFDYSYSIQENIIYHNNLVDNTAPFAPVNDEGHNFLDNGYPSGGNYWSDYIGVDNHSGPNQNQPSSDGIGDTPYVINENNTDHYPLMTPYTPARIFVTLINLDDDVKNADIYVDGVFWKQVSDIEHFETKVTEGMEVDGNQEHTVLISWYEVDSETQYSKSSTVYVAIGQEVTVAFQIDPVFRIMRATFQGWIEETREAIFWGVTQDDHFEVYYDKSLHIQASYVLTIAQAAQHSWNELVPFLGQPYDQDGDGRIEIFVSDIYAIFGRTLVNGLTYYNDLNGLGFIYLDDKIGGGSDFVSAVVSHEFSHRIEFAYADQEPDAQRDGWMLEGIAQFCADYVWDSSGIFQKDYVDPFAKNPDISLVSEPSGYYAGYVYFEFLSEKLGTSIIGEILTKWETGISAVEAVEQATGKTFSELFDEFAKRNYVNDYDGTAKTFEDTDIFLQPFKKHSVNSLKRSVSGSGTVNEWAADYVKFTTSKSLLNISFSGEEGRAYSVMVEKIVGSYTSYSVVDMTLADNEGWVIVENAKEFSQIVLVVIRHDDAYDLGSYTYQAKAG